MPINRPEFAQDELYHVTSRGVGDSLVFKNKEDYQRCLIALQNFNTLDAVEIRGLNGEPFSGKDIDPEDRLVDVLAFCLMPNHIHLLVRQLADNGISEFMRKFGAGYVGYFNRKHNRKGTLLAKFRAVRIDDNDQAMIAFAYIHMNPASIIEPGWKECGIKNISATARFLEKYPWSSWSAYLNGDGSNVVTDKDFLPDIFGSIGEHREFIEDRLIFKTTEQAN